MSEVFIALSMWWPLLYALIIDSLTGLSPSLGSTFLVGLVLVLNSQVFESIGRLLAEIAGMSNIGVGITFASIFSQTLVIAGGFYKTVPASGPAVLFGWVSHINGLKYSFTAVARLWFSWQMPIWAVPQAAQPGFGYTWASIETTGALNALKMRGVTVVDSAAGTAHLSIAYPVTMLIVLTVCIRVACWLIASLKAAVAMRAPDLAKIMDELELADYKARKAAKARAQEVREQGGTPGTPGTTADVFGGDAGEADGEAGGDAGEDTSIEISQKLRSHTDARDRWTRTCAESCSRDGLAAVG